MKYKILPIKGYKVLNMYPVYSQNFYKGKEPFKIIGIREDQVELQGEFSDGINLIRENRWVNDDIVFVVSTVCEEQSKPNGCQVHNIHCCGGGSVINKHVEYWKDLSEETKKPSFNFCEMFDGKLERIIDYLGHSEMLKNNKRQHTFINGVYAESKWKDYNELIVTPTQITYSESPYPRNVIFTIEQFEKLYNLFKNW